MGAASQPVWALTYRRAVHRDRSRSTDYVHLPVLWPHYRPEMPRLATQMDADARELRAAAAANEPAAFISYAREADDELAYTLAEGLRAEGRDAWIDRERIAFASDWRARARAGIEASRAVIFVLSRS